ncbi:Muscle-specific protein 20 [Trichoplax sp. H2]|nr:Muscle-specific protein 20 [Trichoplax sp. H2]|eukprot:RDD37004.1 Muscle-specific protein 20 [Trichoplax sp. H2]
MASRPKGFGLTAELEAKKDTKFDPNLEKDVLKWIGDVIGEEVLEDTHTALKDGVRLCKLANKVQANKYIKYNVSKMAFKMMENIGLFLESTYELGVPKIDMFQTVDLYDGTNIPQVLNGIIAYERKARATGYNGPTLGPSST